MLNTFAFQVQLKNLISKNKQGTLLRDADESNITERQRIAKIFKTHIEKAIEELGVGYDVTLQGEFDKTPIRIKIEVNSKDEIP